MNNIQHWIDGKVVESTSGRTAPVYNPATGEQTGSVASASSPRSTPPSRRPRRRSPAWRATSLSKRAEIMFRMRELVDANRKEIASAAHRRARQGALRRDG